MAESERPVSELYPPEGSVSLDSALITDPFLPLSQSSTDGLTGHPRQEELRKSSSEHTALCSNRDRKKYSQGPTQAVQHTIQQHTPDHVDPRTAVRPHSMAESSYTAHRHEEGITSYGHQASGDVLSAFGESQEPYPSSSSQKDLRGLDLSRLPVQRSHSDTLHMLREVPAPPPRSETSCPLYPGRDYLFQDASPQAFSRFACKQPMQVQNCNPVNTTCRGGNGGGGSPTQQPQAGSVRVGAPGPSNTATEVGDETQQQHSCEEAICYCAFVHHHGALEDTFAAYCHPQPILAPAQLLPRFPGTEAKFRDQRVLPPHPAPTLISLPCLMSSVSETGLDAKRLLQCCNLNCNLNCSWANTLPPSGALQQQEYSCPSSNNRATRNTGTMTSHRELRDVGVQTGQIHEARLAHMFPQVCLVEKNRNENGNESGNETDTSQKSPVKEVKWDAEGMTWEVYGASVDPEELGLAIQKHLELQIKETAGRAANLSCQDTATSRKSSSGAGGRKKRGGVMGSIRTPACCASSSTAVD
ncbi:G protein-regulated inducer of neurite outgrowth 2-like [Salvelinus namaycush]|uniref:G protein-regulated inducer of neurite outgrowth 2-like n=1 Tax=Salvelinus namaycush TaxID=8040 RepID=A0A8U0QP52_SALNM|nr:G protein-regulated inducer of neurite outgrowth 2-like [Salvelinus namaycush]